MLFLYSQFFLHIWNTAVVMLQLEKKKLEGSDML